MKISRQVGTVSQIINVYAQDFSVSTGAGIANIPATTVSYTWFRNNHSGASTGVGVSTASMGAYTSGAWTQINSATALGWYQFGIPNDALLSGDCAGLFLRVSTGAFNMAPIPIEIELTKTNNQQYMSSQTIGFVQNGVNVSSYAGSGVVTTVAGMPDVNLARIQSSVVITTAAGVMTTDNRSIWGSATVTSSAGILTVSTQTLAAALTASGVWDEIATSHSASSSFAQVLKLGMSNVSTLITGVNVSSIMGTSSPARPGYVGVDWAFVTSKASYNDLSSTFISTNQSIAGASAPTAAQVAVAVWSEINSSYSGVSTFGYLAKQVTSISAGVNVTAFSGTITTNANVIQAYGSAIVTSAAGQFRVSTQAIDKGGYGVTSLAAYGTPLVTSAAGILNVSTQTLSVTVDPAAVWNAFTSTYSTAGTFGGEILTSSDAATSSQIIQGVWNELTTAYTSASSTFGLALYTAQSASGLTSTVVGDAVWSRINSSYSGVSTFGYLARQITSVAAGVNVTAFSGTITTNANVMQIYGSAAVTSASGQFRVSTQAIDKGGYGVTTIASNITTNANLMQVYGSAIVTSASGILTVSTQTLGTLSGSVNVTSINGSPAVTSGAGILTVSTQTLAGGSGSVNVTSIAGASVVTTAAGVLLVSTQSLAGIVVSTQTIPTFAVAGDAMALTSGERASLAGVILTTTQSESFRSVNAPGSLMQMQYEILANLTEFSNSGTTRTLNSVTSHAAGVATYQYNSTTPSAITRTA